MKIKSFFIIFLLFMLTGCSAKDKEVWNIEFQTSYSSGVYYFINNETIFTSSGELAFQNVSEVPVHLFIYNDTVNGKLEYEADLDLGGILSYSNLDKNSRYTVGIRVFDGRGYHDIKVLAFSDFDFIY